MSIKIDWIANTSISISDYSILPSIHQIIWFQQHSTLITNTSHPIHTIITLLSSPHHPFPSFPSIPYTLLSREWGRVECSIKQTSSHMSISLTPLVECLMEQTLPSHPLNHLYHSVITALAGIEISFTSLVSPHSINPLTLFQTLHYHLTVLIKAYRCTGLVVSTEVIWLVVAARIGCVVSDGNAIFRTRIDELESCMVSLTLPISITLSQCVWITWNDHLSDLWFSEWFEILWFTECEGTVGLNRERRLRWNEELRIEWMCWFW